MLARLVFAFLIFTLPALAKEPPPSIVQKGKASIYADRFQGQLAANGEPHDQNDLTAASRLLPLGARATVTNLETGKSVQVEITDRGPYAGGRIIDLSRRAAREIGLTLKMGVARVTVEAIPARQPTPALKEEVAQIAAARAKPAPTLVLAPARALRSGMTERPIPPHHDLAWLADLLDSRWRIPGTSWRFGVDSVAGLVPGAGDLVAGLAGAYILIAAHRAGAPANIKARMIGNIAVDTVVGSIPILGGIFDLFFKSNQRNLRLFAKHMAERQS